MSAVQKFSITRNEISGLSVLDLASKFGTPSYIYDADTIRARISELKQFDVIRFAQKANSNIAVLNLMRENGVVVDAVSSGEVHRARAAGYSVGGGSHDVVYTADIFDREALDMVVDQDLPVNCGSPDMIAQLGKRAPGREITLRINPGFGHGHSNKTNTGGQSSKHGIWHEQLDHCIELAKEHGLIIAGLHMHIGSGTDFEHLSQVCDAMKQTALEIEPGRFLVAESGYLVAEIRAIKQMGENLFYLVDAGFNNLARPILYGSYHPMSVAFANESTVETQGVIVGGPLCESGDIFTQEEGGFVCSRELPKANVGDFLVIECAGAYGFVMSSNYNSKPLAAEILIDGGKAHLIRKRQTPEDILAGESIPS